MCHILFQVYACNHEEAVCTTPCPHALKDASSDPGPASSSNQGHIHINTSHTVGAKSPTSPEHVHRGARFPTPSMSVSRNVSVKSFGSTSGVSLLSVPPPQHAGNTHSQDQPNTATLSLHSAPAPQSSAPMNKEPKLCPYFFPRHLSRSRYPCLECYMHPKWAPLRRRWVAECHAGHPWLKPEEMEFWAGIKQIPERVGLLNVFVDTGEKKVRDDEYARGRE